MFPSCCIVGILVAQISIDQQPLNQPALVRTLETGGPRDRLEALRLASQVEPRQRSADLVRVLADELVRVNSINAAQSRGEAVAGGDNLQDYFPELIRINAESDDPVVIPGLVGALQTGNMAIKGVARFGSRAFTALQAVLADQSADPMRRDGAAAAFVEILATDRTFGAHYLAELTHQVMVLLARPEPFVVVASLVPLAVDLADKDLLTTVSRIADDPNVALLSDADARDRLNIQARAKRALTRR